MYHFFFFFFFCSAFNYFAVFSNLFIHSFFFVQHLIISLSFQICLHSVWLPLSMFYRFCCCMISRDHIAWSSPLVFVHWWTHVLASTIKYCMCRHIWPAIHGVQCRSLWLCAYGPWRFATVRPNKTHFPDLSGLSYSVTKLALCECFCQTENHVWLW